MNTDKPVEHDKDYVKIPCYTAQTQYEIKNRDLDVLETENIFVTDATVTNAEVIAPATRKELFIEQQTIELCKKIRRRLESSVLVKY